MKDVSEIKIGYVYTLVPGYFKWVYDSLNQNENPTFRIDDCDIFLILDKDKHNYYRKNVMSVKILNKEIIGWITVSDTSKIFIEII